MKRIILTIVLIFSMVTISSAAIVRKDIVSANLGRITFDRTVNTNLDTGEKTVSITMRLDGYYVDEDGATVPGKTVQQEYNWKDIPDKWKEVLVPMFKAISREFNRTHANEDVETFDITETPVETTTTTTTTVP